MKKALTLITFCILFAINANATITITREHGGLFGYKYVDYTRTDTYTHLFCCDPGFTRCKVSERPSPNNNEDAVDIKNLYDLVDYADLQIEQNNLSGSHNIRIHVNGEECDRIYVVYWNYSDAQNGTTICERLTDVCN